MERRHFLGLMAITPAFAAFPKLAEARRPDLSRVPTRNANPIEVLYETPHGHPNGMDSTREGMWIIDQSPGNYASLINPDTGALIREVQVANIRGASGICIDDDNVMWIGSTGSRFIVAANPADGSTIAKYMTPGASAAYRLAGDAPQRGTGMAPSSRRRAEDPVWAEMRARAAGATAAPPAPPPPPIPDTAEARAAANSARSAASHLPAGQVPIDMPEARGGSGAHCVLSKGNMLYIAVPPARLIYTVDKRNWEVQDMWSTAGSRPHDMTWADDAKSALWSSDSNLNAFYLHDGTTGLITQAIQLPSDSPVIHGAKLHNGYMYCCDDVGWMFRFRM